MNLTEADFNTWSAQYTKGSNQKVSNGYKEISQDEESLILPETMFVKTKIEDAIAVKKPILETFRIRQKDTGLRNYIHRLYSSENLFSAV